MQVQGGLGLFLIAANTDIKSEATVDTAIGVGADSGRVGASGLAYGLRIVERQSQTVWKAPRISSAEVALASLSPGVFS